VRYVRTTAPQIDGCNYISGVASPSKAAVQYTCRTIAFTHEIHLMFTISGQLLLQTLSKKSVKICLQNPMTYFSYYVTKRRNMYAFDINLLVARRNPFKWQNKCSCSLHSLWSFPADISLVWFVHFESTLKSSFVSYRIFDYSCHDELKKNYRKWISATAFQVRVHVISLRDKDDVR